MGHKHKLLLIGVLFMFCFRTISLIFFVNAPLFGKVYLGFISFIWMVLADPVQTCKQWFTIGLYAFTSFSLSYKALAYASFNNWLLYCIVLSILNNQTSLPCLILSSSLDNGHLMQIPLSLVSTATTAR